MIRWRVRGTPTWTNLDPGAGMMTHLHTGRQSGTTYHYQVAATNSAGTGPWSDEESDTTMSMAKPATPTGVTVMDDSDVAEDGMITTSQIKVSWNKVSGATGYEIMRWLTAADPAWGSVDGMAGGQTVVPGGDTIFYEDVTGLGVGMTYHYIVRAVNGTIKGDWTASMSGTTKLAKPTLELMPLVATPVGESMIRLSWSEVMDAPEATSYELRFIATVGKPGAPRDSDYTMIPLNPPTRVHYIHTGRTAGTSYEYSVRAVLPDGGMSDWSDPPEKETTRPARPTMFSAQASSDTEVALTWKHVSFDGSDLEADVSYEVEVRVGGKTTWADVATTCDGGTPVVCSATHGAMAETQYYYRLRAIGMATEDETYSYWVYANETHARCRRVTPAFRLTRTMRPGPGRGASFQLTLRSRRYISSRIDLIYHEDRSY